MIHFSEPWHIEKPTELPESWSVWPADGKYVCHFDRLIHEFSSGQADSVRRIVACVNACYGIPTEAMESAESWAEAGVATAQSLRNEIARLQAQRDELVTLLVESRKWQAEGEHGDPLPPEYWTPDYAAYINRLDAAIANCTKDQA